VRDQFRVDGPVKTLGECHERFGLSLAEHSKPKPASATPLETA
jgi:hypothetical protein